MFLPAKKIYSECDLRRRGLLRRRLLGHIDQKMEMRARS